ncbi:MAG: hypothetical protein QOI79_35 [Mycobacterium sp.]|jgi:hypothetical protein|nr:hypothetical protein [Mycobacterium sp.]MDT5140716.1 hypothetical protein [Mycobacterium sp.]
MIGRDTGLDAGGFRLRPSAVGPIGALVRTRGAFERIYHRYEQKSTMHFCVVAELAQDLVPSALDAGLLAVQCRHPLLNGYAEDHQQTRLGFYRPVSVPPIPVTVVDAGTRHSWCDGNRRSRNSARCTA